MHYKGSCHCGQLAFEGELEAAGVLQSASICARRALPPGRAWQRRAAVPFTSGKALGRYS
jgi:hypothetical protein